MKIKLNGFEFLKQRFLNEGDELVTHGADLYLNEEADGAFPKAMLDALGITLDKGPEIYRFLKFFNKDFSPQTIVALPLRGLIGEGLGYDTEVGMACRFVSAEPDIFMNEILIETLQEMNYTGFVYAAYNDELCSFGLGAGMAFYNVLESIEGTLTDFLNINDRLLESWTLSILLTRYPYPFKLKANNIAFKIYPQAYKHMHLWDCQKNKNLFYTNSTKIGVACSWATTLLEAEKRVLRTLDGLEIPQKQYRRDIASSVRWFEIKNQVMTS
jgi:hypothetical protein